MFKRLNVRQPNLILSSGRNHCVETKMYLNILCSFFASLGGSVVDGPISYMPRSLLGEHQLHPEKLPPREVTGGERKTQRRTNIIIKEGDSLIFFTLL